MIANAVRPVLATAIASMVSLSGCSSVHCGAKENKGYSQDIPGAAARFEMVWIEDGAFWIGRHEVTWNEYLQYCNFQETDEAPLDADAVSRPSEPVIPYDRDWGFGRRPAVGMSWNAARQYCRWLSLKTGHSYRLPTEQEWELACGDAGYEPFDDHVWHNGNCDDMTHEVGEKLPNASGLHDMLGNLWEYCGNPFSEGEPERAVLRGGSWKENAAQISPAHRLGFEDDWVLADPNVPAGVWWVPDGDHLGFRVLRAAEK